MTERVVALVPMRHSSERVPGKNYRPFAGLPLYHHVVKSLLATPGIDEVVIDTDSDHIAEEAPALSDRLRILRRPVHLLGGHVAMNDVLLHDVSRVEASIYLQTHSTNPLLSSDTIAAALRLFSAERDQFDSLFSVTPLQARLWSAAGVPINHDPGVLARSQDLPPVYAENSNLYLFTRRTLEARRSRIGERPLMFEIDRVEAWDIDDEVDFFVGERLFERRAAAR